MALDLFSFAGVSEQVESVFKSAQILNKKTNTAVGTRYSRAKAKDVAVLLDLQGKANRDKLNRVVKEIGKTTWHEVRGKLSGLNEYELMSLTEQVNTKGERVIALRVKEIVETLDFEGIAKALGITVDEVKAKVAEQRKKDAHIEVKSETVPPAALPETGSATDPASEPAETNPMPE